MSDAADQPVGFFRQQQARGAGFRKLTWDRVKVIRERIASGESQRSVAKAEGISKSAVHSIASNQAWVIHDRV